MNVPKISIAIPTFNRANYLRQAIDSILAQTFTDFELIISDNGSTDGTEEICREYAAKDSRIRYFREEKNRGAAWNHSRVVELARGEYFKWQCDDDFCAPEMVEKCIAELERDPHLVVVYPQFVRINADGTNVGIHSSQVQGRMAPHQRFRSLIHRRDSCEEIYGVMRTAAVRQTQLIGPYTGSDNPFLAEMLLRGQFGEIPEPLFYYRLHKGQSTSIYSDRLQRMQWFDPGRRGHLLLPSFVLFRAYLSAIYRSPLSWLEKLRCYSSMLLWTWKFRFWLYDDLASVFYLGLIPFLKHHMGWTRPIWHRINPVLLWTSDQIAKVYRPKRPFRPERPIGWDGQAKS